MPARCRHCIAQCDEARATIWKAISVGVVEAAPEAALAAPVVLSDDPVAVAVRDAVAALGESNFGPVRTAVEVSLFYLPLHFK